ncbi:hypothetical protein H8356DRAFT_1706764 [Neocallimastix lanati (nom. inval.)]|jgi:phospholipase/lecithinase/hemolysin|uniref:SGNH hydrolase n=1 Tax=Neocallimastix californiae TaxID=1754190 RepID=A0A1Y1YBC7_9FUNG|nr:hypothetical protein H8356DRAFT_1706764 [Neocallimastix sp. JGI-2020a]ORX95320.1 hypothetical protein LY90DRAFT_709696 [Neocallimastix californiae]|eukprot:ORX95320.1 hypothetical protein LY90DRAFT_709696 [Neocallimastix californiae]
MKYLYFNIILILLAIGYSKGIEEGHVNSYYYPSNDNELRFNYPKLNNLIVFGDSYSTTNTNFYDMTYTGENQSGGKNWPLFLLDKHDMYLWNFAVGGATFTNSYVIRSHRYTLIKQYEIFKSKMVNSDQFNQWKGNSTMVVFWFGINDILKSTRPQNETVDEGLQVMINIMEELYNQSGVRNFLHFYVPPFDKSPQVVNGAYRDVLKFIMTFNTGIRKKIEEFSKSHPLANYIIYNSFDEFEYILENHEQYNITDIKNEYEKHPKRNRDEFYWNNANHPLEKVHKLFTEDLHTYLNSISTVKVDQNTSYKKANSHFVMASSSLKKFKIENTTIYCNFSFLIIILYLIFI